MKDTYGIQEVKAEIAKTLRKHMEEHEAFLVELYKSHPEMEKVSPPGHEKQIKNIAASYEKEGEKAGKAKAIAIATAWKQHKEHGAHKAEAKPSVFHSAPSAIPKGVSHGHPMDTKKPVGKAACEKCGMAKCMGKCDMSDVKPEVAKASCEKCGKAECACEKSMSKSDAQLPPLARHGIKVHEAVTFEHEPPQWFVTVNGYQHGGDIDQSGAGNLTFPSEMEAYRYAKSLVPKPKMSKSEFDELAAFVNTVSLYKGEDKNINTGNEKMASLADEAQGGKGPAKTGSTEEVSEGSGSGGDVLKGKKLGKALSIPSAKPKAPSIPKLPAKAPAAPAAAGPAGTKGDEPAKKSVHNIF